MKHTFNWQKEDRRYGNQSFLGWLLPHLFVFADNNVVFNKVAEKSNNYENVEIGITINGEEIDAKGFIEDLERVIKGQAEAEAKEALASLDYLDKMHDQVTRLESMLKGGVDRAARELGIELSSWD